MSAGQRRVSRRRIDAAINTLGDLTAEEHHELDGGTRDEVSHVIYALEQVLERKAGEHQ